MFWYWSLAKKNRIMSLIRMLVFFLYKVVLLVFNYSITYINCKIRKCPYVIEFIVFTKIARARVKCGVLALNCFFLKDINTTSVMYFSYSDWHQMERNWEFWILKIGAEMDWNIIFKSFIPFCANMTDPLWDKIWHPWWIWINNSKSG